MNEIKVTTYDEAKEVLHEFGILPLAKLFSDFPSLDKITEKSQWYTETEQDPWMWRAKFPADGEAAYGKFIKKKSVLISKQILPLVKVILGSEKTVEERYLDGLISKDAVELYQIISEEQGIDTRILRAKANMKEKEKKKAFDKAIFELQESMDIVIAGTKGKVNEIGEKNGWSSTSYQTLDYWMKEHQIQNIDIEVEDAKRELKQYFEAFCSEEAMKGISKVFKLGN